MDSPAFVVWLTGLPGSGKTTISRLLYDALKTRGLRLESLDGDVIRKELSPELGFTKQDRETNVRRAVFLGKLLHRNGVSSIVSFISPYRATRDYARKEIGKDFLEVYVKAPLEECIKRDPKGLYRKALAGQITDLTGLQDPYEEPLNPELVMDTSIETPGQSCDRVLKMLEEKGYLGNGDSDGKSSSQSIHEIEGIHYSSKLS